MNKTSACFFSLVLGLMVLTAEAQFENDTVSLYRIETKDGNEYVGKIISHDTESILLATPNLGEIRIMKKDMIKLDRIESGQIRQGRIWYPNLQSTRYFFAPNGYGLKKGEIYYQNVWIMFNQFSFGVSDYFSIGAGIIPLFLFAGSPTPAWIIPKVSIPVVRDKFNIGAGALIGGVIGVDESGFGIVYGMTTFGSRDKNVSIGLGYGYAAGDFANKPMVNLSSFIRISPRGYFVTENYFIPIEDELIVLLSMGGRSIIKRVGLDYGLFLPIVQDMDTFFIIPWLGITVPLHKTKSKLPGE